MNLPTKITLTRIAMVPIIIIFFCLSAVFKQYYIPMTLLFILTSTTDAIDGHLARKNNMVTDLGKFLDPIADKILVLTGLIILLCMNFVTKTGEVFPVLPPYLGAIGVIVILTREFIIGVLRQMAASKGSVLAADKLGKAKTVMTLIAIPMLMLVPFINENNEIVKWVGIVFLFLGWVLFAVSVILTVLSGANYIIKNKHVFLDAKKVEVVAVDTAQEEPVACDETENNTEIIE